MKRKRNSIFTALLVCAFSRVLFAGASASVFYPVNSTFYRMIDPNGQERMFERSVFDRSHLFGEGDWEGRFRGREVTLASGEVSKPEKGTVYLFRDGLLMGWTQDGIPQRFAPVTTESLAQLKTYPSQEEIDQLMEEAEEKADLWKGSERLRFFSDNPNISSIVLGMLVLVFWGLIFCFRCLILRFVCGLFVVLGVIGIFATGSRSGVLAFLMGVGVQVLVELIRRRKFLILSLGTGLCIIAAVLLFVFGPQGRFTRDLLKADELRTDINKNFPAMIADSPLGVGTGNSGAIYDTWYRNPEIKRAVRTLVGSHQTILLERGVLGRVLYIGVWAFVLVWLLRLALMRGHVIPFSLGAALLFAGFFNPIYEAVVTWLVPAFALMFALGWMLYSWRDIFRGKFAVYSAGEALLLACFVVVVLWGMGSRKRGAVQMKMSPDKVVVSHAATAAEPSTWIVDDEFVLGGWLFTGQEILLHYEMGENLPSLALVEELDVLPRKVEKLVLAGRSVEEYVKRWQDPAQREKLSKAQALLLLSPSLDPRTLPEDLVASVRIRAVVGSLAAPKLGLTKENLPKWVRLTPGALLYIPSWITLAQTF